MTNNLSTELRKTVFHIVLFIVVTSCLDRIDIGNPENPQQQIVIDGFISDEPGPYKVRLTRSLGIYDDLRKALPFSAERVSIFDNFGNIEALTEVELGQYETSPTGIRGVVGREYTLRIEARDGKIYESVPERITPAGSIDSIYYELVSSQPSEGPTTYGFKILIDSEAPASDNENYLRWKFTGTYKVKTNPELHTVRIGEAIVPDPIDCCEICWVTQLEDKPVVSDNQIVSEGKFNNVEVGLVPVNGWTFYEKYLVEVAQMSLSRTAFDYWRIVQFQKEGAGSLFQPPLGRPETNVFNINGTTEVQGIFYATSITRKQVFILPEEIPFTIPVPTVIPDWCLVFDLSTLEQPPNWK